jgi:hypothetical protein
MGSGQMKRRICFPAAAAILTLVAAGRVVMTYSTTAQAWDEPCHIAAGMEWVDRGTYHLDPVHPPLSRIAMGLPLFLAGVRYPAELSSDLPSGFPLYWVVGRNLLYGDGHYLRNLSLARSGMLPFLFLASAIVFLWTRRAFGDVAALVSVFLFTTLPIVLGFSGVAYTDIPATATQLMALLSIALWLEKPSLKSSLFLGFAVGLALLSKFTSLVYLPVATAGMVSCRWLLRRNVQSDHPSSPRAAVLLQRVKLISLAALIACLMVWGGYRFSFDHIVEAVGIVRQPPPTFQHFPRPLAALGRKLLIWDPKLPAVEMFSGLANLWSITHSGADAYIFGHIKSGSWWYFFLVGLGVKAPIPFLLLCIAGVFFTFKRATEIGWAGAAPAASLIALLMATMFVSYDAGMRHVLLLFPLLAVVAGFGALRLWQLQSPRNFIARALVIVLLVWQGAASYGARADYLAYFNELAGKNPSRILVTGCDSECGQDVFRLSLVLQEKRILSVHMAVWSSADLAQMDFPEFQPLLPYTPVTGWVAVGLRSLRTGEVGPSVSLNGEETRDAAKGPPFAWIENYQPVEHVGKTINLYYIPAATALAR